MAPTYAKARLTGRAGYGGQSISIFSPVCNILLIPFVFKKIPDSPVNFETQPQL